MTAPVSEMKLCQPKAVIALGLTSVFRKLSVGRTEKERKTSKRETWRRDGLGVWG